MRTEALLEMVGLKAVAGRPVGTYSKGMARRIGLAQALINDPDLLILDEPTTGLDPIGTRQIKDLILKLAERGKTILLCSHLLADVEDVCDRIAILYGGRIQAQGRVKDLLQQTKKRQIVTDAISDATIERIKHILSEAQAECEISSPMERLEAFFIHTVAEAQQAATPTSGAVSTTQIGDFLAAEASKESILDRLVSTPEPQDETPAPVTTEEPVRPESGTPEPDRQLLSELTKPTARPETHRVTPMEKPQAKPVEHTDRTEHIKKSVLDELTERSSSSEGEEESKKGQSEDGESDHA
jgi:ABC-2 type transport system ATP-binding protein